eukprot:108944-Prymnesium_polylepis.2
MRSAARARASCSTPATHAPIRKRRHIARRRRTTSAHVLKQQPFDGRRVEFGGVPSADGYRERNGAGLWRRTRGVCIVHGDSHRAAAAHAQRGADRAARSGLCHRRRHCECGLRSAATAAFAAGTAAHQRGCASRRRHSMHRDAQAARPDAIRRSTRKHLGAEPRRLRQVIGRSEWRS